MVANNDKRKKKSKYFVTYVSKILKNISPTNGITNDAKQQLNGLLCYFATRLSNLSTDLTLSSNKRTISIKEVSAAAKLCFNGDLLEKALEHANKAVKTYTENKKNPSKDQKSLIINYKSNYKKILNRKNKIQNLNP